MVGFARASAWATLLLLIATPSVRADWTRFRGPNGSGISADSGSTPTRWSASANVKWKTKLPGSGVSSPIIVGDRVFVTCYSGYGLDQENPGDQKNLRRHVVCVDRETGKTLWSRDVEPVLPEDPYEGIGVTAHGYASSTPVSDGNSVFVFFGKTGALAFDLDGKQLWQTSVGTESDPRRWGSASSPILHKNLLIVPAAAESEALVALDKKTGKEVWRQSAAGFSNSWSSPILVKVDKTRTDLVIAVTKEIWGLNPDTGKLRWFCEAAKARSFCSSAVAEGDVVFAIEGQSGVSLAVRAGGQGDVTKTHVLWTGRNSSRFGTPIVHHDRIYTFGSGIASVTDAKTGKRLSQTRLASASSGQRGMGGDYGSPILADGKLYYVRQSGDMFVLRPDDKLEQLAVNRVVDAGEVFNSTPSVSGGDLFIRSDKHLYCLAPMGQEVTENLLAARESAAGSGDGDAEAGSGRGGEGGRQGRRNRGGGGRRGGFDPAEMFKSRDTNGDGKLSGDEISGRMKGFMEQLDADKDGDISLEEFKKGMSRGGRGRRGSRGGGSPRSDKPERPQRPELEKSGESGRAHRSTQESR